VAFTLEHVLTSPRCFGLIKATPLQRACCRIVDGLELGDLVEQYPELVEQLEVTLGTNEWRNLHHSRPLEVYAISGIRTGKSLIFGAALAFRAAMTVDLSILQPWEEAVISILSITLKKARIIMRHLAGPLLARPHLRALMPRPPTTSTLWLRRPHDGRIVRIEIAAGAKAGGALVGDWSAGAYFDEHTRMVAGDEGSVVNFDEQRNAVLGRLLPGAQLVGMGAPWAPRGAAYQIHKDYFGTPREDLVVVCPPTKWMNPAYWTKERIEKLRRSPKGEHVYKTDYLGLFAAPGSGFLSPIELATVTRKGGPLKLEHREGVQYFAAMDPAFRRNAWTLVITGREYLEDGRFRIDVVFAKQWIPKHDAPLKPKEILKQIAVELAGYGLTEVQTDGWRSEELASIGQDAGISVALFDGERTQEAEVRMFDAFRLRVLEQTTSLPDDPEFLGDLQAVRKIVGSRTIRMDLPVTPDGRHCDYAPALVKAHALASDAPGWMHAMGQLEKKGGRFGL
jgi:hypothetical protein